MKRLLLCADDYAIAPGVSAAIRDLVGAGRINATSVMTVFPGLEDEAQALDAVAAGRRVSIGLHVTLTGPMAPLTAGLGPAFGTLPGWIGAAFAGRLDAAAVAAEVEAQFARFLSAFGRPPDHVDGHQHVHVLPTVRGAVLEATRRHAPEAILRDVTPTPAALRGFDAKGRLIGLFAHNFARDARRRGLATSTGFGGAYDFTKDGDFAGLMARVLGAVPEGGVVMVHPGHADATLATRDRLIVPREREYTVLAGPDFPAILQKAGVRLD